MSNQGPSHSLTIQVRIARKPGALARVAAAVGDNEGLLGSLPVVKIHKDNVIRDIDIYARDEQHENVIIKAISSLPDTEILLITDRTFAYHEGGKIEVRGKRILRGREDLSMAYTPGVGRVSLATSHNVKNAYKYTMKGNAVAIVTDGTAVLGLGAIGPLGALPVMEGKALLFKEFAGINAFPLCLNVTDIDAIIAVCKAIVPNFAGINLEDISAPRCFEIERRLAEEVDIPVFHDDQHGTAIAVLAALHNALHRVKKKLEDVRILISGTGAAGVACVHILLEAGAKHIIACDRTGALYPDRPKGMNSVKRELAEITNLDRKQGKVNELLEGMDVFIGVSGSNLLQPEDLKVMAEDAIVFALANPDPEVDPWGALEYARIVATGRSDFPNQINNALVFPGIFRGALDSRARTINSAMKTAAARAIADLVKKEELADQHIIPSIFDPAVCPAVAKAVAQAAKDTGVVTL